jgi:hypothetical protein
MRGTRISCRVVVGILDGKRGFERLSVGGRMILKCILNKWCRVA